MPKKPVKKTARKKARKKTARKKAAPRKNKATVPPGKGTALTAQKNAPLPVSVSTLPKRVKEALEPLSILKRRFVIFYCTRANGNGALAARLAGVNTGNKGGQSPKNVLSSRATQMLHDPLVLKARDVWMEEFAMSKAMVTRRMTDLAESNLGNFMDLKNGIPVMKKLDEDDWEAHKHQLKRVECDPITGRVTKVEVYDRKAALDSLAKIMGIMSSTEAHLHLHLYKNMTDEELMRELEIHREAVGPITPHTVVGGEDE